MSNTTKVTKAFRFDMIQNIVLQTLRSMFTYKNLPESIPEEFIEKFFVESGSCAGWKLDKKDDKYTGEWIVSTVDLGDRPDVYGRGTRPICSTLNGYVKQFEDFDNVAVGFNNSLHLSDMNFVIMLSNTIMELLTSLDSNIIYARDKKVFKVLDDVQKAQIEEAFKNVKEDEPVVFTVKRKIAELMLSDNNIPDVELLDITDVKNSDKLQYIIKSIEDVTRIAYTLYGQAIQGNGKLAQQSVEEVQGNTSTSFIIPNDKLKMRKRWVEEFNKISGLNIEVDFSDAWKTEELKYKEEADIDKDAIIDTEDDEIETTTEEEVTEDGKEDVQSE